MKVPFRVRREYYNAIAAGTKTSELRGDTPYWRNIARKVQLEFDASRKVEGVFVCGKDVLRKNITCVSYHKSAEVALGRPLSEQGMKDVGSGPVIAFHVI